MAKKLRKRSSNAGFTLFEVMLGLFLISLMCLSVYASLTQITKAAMGVAIRDEAYHLLQAKAEEQLATDFTSFGTAATDTVTSEVKTSFLPSTVTAQTLPTDNNVGRITFTRSIVAGTSSSSAKSATVQVSWTFQGRPYQISVPLYRTNP